MYISNDYDKDLHDSDNSDLYYRMGNSSSLWKAIVNAHMHMFIRVASTIYTVYMGIELMTFTLDKLQTDTYI